MAINEQYHIVESLQPQTHTIIFFHGRGSNGTEVAQDLFECEITNEEQTLKPCPTNLRDKFPTCKWIFPTARQRYSTVFQEDLTEWFDTVSLTDPSQREDLQIPGLIEGVQLLEAIIHNKDAPLDPTKLILGGISQGFATAITAMIALDLHCAGFIGLSGWLPFSRQIHNTLLDLFPNKYSQSGLAATNKVRRLLDYESDESNEALMTASRLGKWVKAPVFLGHERYDPVVAYELGEAAFKVLQMASTDIVLRAYESDEHWISEKGEIEDIAAFIQECIDR